MMLIPYDFTLQTRESSVLMRKELKAIKRAHSPFGIPNHDQESNGLERHNKTSYIWGCYHTLTNHTIYVHRGAPSTVYLHFHEACKKP